LQLSANQRGAAFMVISQAAFTLNDTLVKVATGSIGIGQIMLVRGIFATALITLLVWRLGHFQPPRRLLNPAVICRVVGEIGGTVFYLIALAHLPIANVSAVFQALPLFVTMSAAVFFGEHVGPRRWLAIAVGFVGVMIIVRPGMEGFSSFSIYVLICVAFCAFRDLSTRRVPAEIPSTFISLLTAAAVTLCGGLMIPLTGGWVPLSSSLLAILVAAAFLVLTGYQFIIQSMRVGDISFVAPFRYTALLWAIAAGYIVFVNVPDLPMLIGSVVVVASGIYTLYRERIAGRSKPVTETTGPSTAVDGL
jgi:drug/metabolite transporter (DMT)-like permease